MCRISVEIVGGIGFGRRVSVFFIVVGGTEDRVVVVIGRLVVWWLDMKLCKFDIFSFLFF